MNKGIISALILVASASSVAAQEPVWRPVDRIAAIVGGKPIMMSQVEEGVNVRRANGAAPATPAALDSVRRSILISLVNLELVVQAAQRDTMIKLQDQAIQQQVDDAIRQIRDQYGSDLEFQRQIKLSGFPGIEDYRRWLYEQKRKEALQTEFTGRLRQKGVIKSVPPTDKEAREYYEATKPLQPKRPASVSFRQIVIGPKPDSSALATAFKRADSLVLQLRKGADFNTLAKRFSEDAATKEQGGELNWFRLGSGMVREFEQAAFAMRPGQISDPVRSAFGYHIIQVERVEPAEIQARHILIIPVLTQANLEAANTLVDSVARLVRAGVSWDSLSRANDDASEEKLVEGIPRTALPEEYYAVLQDTKAGDIVGPFQVKSTTGVPKHAIVQFREARPEGEYAFEELRDQIRSRLSDDNAMKRYIETLRKQTYVDIRY
ncbi:MAG: hypothetical protein EXR93_05415 [Gemmatimonadetes bacterium]|nr:hypothetical protein [Gemmatimonadota bacterium]